MVVLGLAVAAAAATYFLYPSTFARGVEKASGIFDKLMGASADEKKHVPVGQQQAQFIAIEPLGEVMVKKSTGDWVKATYELPLEKGDVVRTTSGGNAKIRFADRTEYTIKPDSLIVVEDNSTNAAQQTQVSVEVTTGTVDLATADYAQGSRSQVVVAGATATLAPDSAARVRNDNRNDVHEILVTKGSSEVSREGEVVKLGSYEKVAFKAENKGLVKTREVGPPTLIDPSNMESLVIPAEGRPIQFTWTPIPTARGYHLRISKNNLFSSTEYDKKVTGTETTVVLKPDQYYWVVQTIDPQGNESVNSEINKVILNRRSSDSEKLTLSLENLVQHGHMIEIRGKTEPGARVMVNGAQVPMMSVDGSFYYLTPPFPNGENVITVTAQNAHGGVNTKTQRIIIQ